jgi:L-iditol 2-dehydrogenase
LLIIGGGLAGILHTQLAKAKGVKNIVVADINPFRLRLAEKFGATHTVESKQNLFQKFKDLNNGRLADKVVIASGATPAGLAALECVDKGGTILFFAVPDPTVKIPVPITDFWRNEVTLKTSYGAAPQDLEQSLELLTEKKLNITDMITHKFSIRQAGEGFRLVASAGESLKVIIEPNTT